MKLSFKDIQCDGELYRFHEPIKYRFKEKQVIFPISYRELIWDSCSTERGLTKRKVRERKAKARKPYWKGKRREQRRAKNKWKREIYERITFQ